MITKTQSNSTKQHILYILSALVLSVVTVASVVTQAYAIDSLGVGAVPAYPNKENPRAQSIFIYQLKPGKTVNDGIKIVNNNDDRKTISVYPVDSDPSSDGSFACKQKVEPKKSVGSWLHLAKTEVILEGHTEEIIPFTLTVPKDADVGEYNGCVAIQEMRKNEATGNGIVLAFRSALRVAVMVPGTIHAELTVEKFDVTDEKEKVLASPLLHNTGNVSVDAQVNVFIKDIFGNDVDKQGGRFPILRDTSSRFNLELTKPLFWGGWYTVGGSTAYSPLQTSSKAGALSSPQDLPTKKIFIMPDPRAQAMLLGAALLVLAAIGLIIWRVIYGRQMHRRAYLYEVVEGDDIQTLAQVNHTKWKSIAQLNHLKPPYRLRPGTKIKIPGKRPSSVSRPNKLPRK